MTAADAIGLALLMVGSAAGGAALALAYFEDLRAPKATVQDLHIHIGNDVDAFSVAAAVKAANRGAISA